MIELYNDDCLKVLGTIGDDTVDLIVTDPPYNLGEFAKSRAANLQNMRDKFFVAAGWDNVGYDEWKELMNSFFKEAARVSKVGGSLLMFMSIMKLETIIEMAVPYLRIVGFSYPLSVTILIINFLLGTYLSEEPII